MFANILANANKTNLSKMAWTVYGTGIVGNIVYSIADQNKKVLRKQIKGDDIDYTDYAMHSIFGLGIGFYSGLFLPITALGQLTLQIDKILTVSKNN